MVSCVVQIWRSDELLRGLLTKTNEAATSINREITRKDNCAICRDTDNNIQTVLIRMIAQVLGDTTAMSSEGCEYQMIETIHDE